MGIRTYGQGEGQMSGYIYSTGEFAKLCGTTKDTLFHYDHLGVLKPAITKDNGYRYYHATQLYLFNLITDLNESGVSLAEIKNCFDYREVPEYTTVLQQALDHLLRKRQHLESSIRYLDDTLRGLGENAIDRAEKPQEDTFQIVLGYSEEFRYVECARCTDLQNPSEFSLALNAAKRAMRQRSDVLSAEPFLVIPKQAFAQDDFAEAAFCARVQDQTARECATHPAGVHASLLYHGNLKRMTQAIERFRHYIDHCQYSVCSDLHIKYQLIYQPKERRLAAPLALGQAPAGASQEQHQATVLSERFSTALDAIMELTVNVSPAQANLAGQRAQEFPAHALSHDSCPAGA